LAEALQGVKLPIADLGGLTRGRGPDGAIWLDDDAAGWGWFVDQTQRDDSKFYQPDQNRMDLLTVPEHELGHEHKADGVMQEALTAGTRGSAGSVAAADLGLGDLMPFSTVNDNDYLFGGLGRDRLRAGRP